MRNSKTLGRKKKFDKIAFLGKVVEGLGGEKVVAFYGAKMVRKGKPSSISFRKQVPDKRYKSGYRKVIDIWDTSHFIVKRPHGNKCIPGQDYLKIFNYLQSAEGGSSDKWPDNHKIYAIAKAIGRTMKETEDLIELMDRQHLLDEDHDSDTWRKRGPRTDSRFWYYDPGWLKDSGHLYQRLQRGEKIRFRELPWREEEKQWARTPIMFKKEDQPLIKFESQS